MIKIQTEDGYIYQKENILAYLYDCWINDRPAVIDLDLEGGCAESMGMYSLLDRFCYNTGYDPHRVTLITGNLIEAHDRYQIKFNQNYWFELPLIQQWSRENTVMLGVTPRKHFGCFVGQSRWPRLWMSAWLYKNHRDSTLQTFHSGFAANYRTKKSDGVYDWLGLDQLNQFECGMIPDVAEFLKHCPMTIDDDLQTIKTTDIIFDQQGHYPLQHPANLSIISYYSNIFLDIVMETSVTGNAFFVTEKLWRCIVARRPFAVVSNRDYLQNLRNLGFKTFHDYWSEDYDGLSNQDRIGALQIELNKIAQWSPTELQFKLNHMQDILDHNWSTFMSLSWHDLKVLREQTV